MAEPNAITIRHPDDWHLHLRDGAVMAAVLPFTARRFARAIVMPNLTPPVKTAKDADAYKARILAALPEGSDFRPLMTCYLTDDADGDAIVKGYRAGAFQAVKLYPAGATTHSDRGVSDIGNVAGVLARMEAAGMPLLVHGETTDPAVDVYDREAAFIESILAPLAERFPGLRIVFEHVTTIEALDFVAGAGANVAATITAHHLMINRTDMFRGGIRPHLYCLPVAKRERHRIALRKAATSGSPKFFLGTDSAPHPVRDKESACGCAGIFTAPAGLELYAQVFAEEGALDRLEAFASLNGPAFYGIEPNEERVTLERREWRVPGDVEVEGEGKGGAIRPFMAGETVGWALAES